MAQKPQRLFVQCPLEGFGVCHSIVKNCKHFNSIFLHCHKPFLLLALIQKCNIWGHMSERIQVFTRPGMITLPQRRVGLLSSGHPCQVHVIFVQILKRLSPQECAIPSHSTAQSHIITATFAIKSRARRCSKHGFIAFQVLFRDQRRV